jgi:hypothetical protein
MKRSFSAFIALFVLGSFGLTAPLDTDPSKDNQVSPAAGNWLVCVASFSGDHAEELAREMALVIRRDYHLPAYCLDRGKAEREKQRAELEKMRQLCPEGRFKHCRIEEQVAVLVGGYKDMAEARRALDGIRTLQPPPDKFCVMGERVQSTVEKGSKGVNVEQVRINPFATAFVAHNPTVPHEQDNAAQELEFLKKLNAGESLSLLNNKKPWTLLVKEFHGIGMIQPASSSSKVLDFFGLGDKRGEHLTAAGVNAQKFAEVLQKMKEHKELPFDAYVLHTRTSSLVAVGGYDSPDDPQMARDRALLSKITLQPKDSRVPVVNTQFLMQPMPMPVPGREAGR